MSEPGIDLNALEDEARRLLSLLTDRQPGLFTWNMALAARLRTIHEMIAPYASGVAP